MKTNRKLNLAVAREIRDTFGVYPAFSPTPVKFGKRAYYYGFINITTRPYFAYTKRQRWYMFWKCDAVIYVVRNIKSAPTAVMSTITVQL